MTETDQKILAAGIALRSFGEAVDKLADRMTPEEADLIVIRCQAAHDRMDDVVACLHPSPELLDAAKAYEAACQAEGL